MTEVVKFKHLTTVTVTNWIKYYLFNILRLFRKLLMGHVL